MGDEMWISVKDKIPEESQEVIAYDPDWGIIRVNYYDNSFHNAQGCSCCDGFKGEWLKVNFWMPLPEKPEGEK